MEPADFADLPADSPAQFDVAIVGAGVSGLYCARQIVRADPGTTVAIVERLDRTGGRLDTDLIHTDDGTTVREEEGGMRFNYGMVELMRLVADLGLCDQIVHFPMSSDDPHAGNTNRFHVRGHDFSAQEAADGGNVIWGELFDLAPEERGLSPTDLVTTAYRNVLLANAGRTDADGNPLDTAFHGGREPEWWTTFRTQFTWDGIPLNEWQLWGLLRTMGHSEECIQMLTETIGFAGPFVSMANAGDAFQILADFPKVPTYFTFADGFSTLPNALRDDLLDHHADEVSIHLSSNVDAITRDGEEFVLSVTEAPDEQDAFSWSSGGEARQVRAGRLFLAVAAAGAQQLFIDSPAMRDRDDARELWGLLHASLGMPLMKINLYFERPWWNDGQLSRPPVQFGPNLTDLPLNAVYPFYGENAFHELTTPGEDPPDAGIQDVPSALTIYCDDRNTRFWHGLQDVGPLFASPLQEQQDAQEPHVLFAASQAVVAEARRQLGTLFGASWVPEPILTSYRLWDGEDDFEFAYHQWRTGVDDAAVRASLSQPFERLHVCNEAYSDMHGWVNGSLRSCDAALAHLDIDPMSNDPCTDPDESQRDPQPARATGPHGL